jgi:L,D-transpeptidase YcbB
MAGILAHRNRSVSLLLGLLLAGSPAASSAQSALTVSTIPLARVTTAGVTDIKFADGKALKEFYGQRGGQPVWADYAQARLALALLDQSWTQGLNPGTYHVKELHALLDDPVRFHTEEARADVVLSDAVVRYGHDVSGMRINPAAIDQRAVYWRQPEKAADILKTVGASPEPAKTVAALAPHDTLYLSLRKEMERISQEGGEYDRLLPMNFGKAYFHPRSHSASIPVLRARLGVKYDPHYGPENFYDDKLAAAVMFFQKQHNIKPDGVIGGKTLALLNQTRRDRMEQLVVNFERLRWLDQQIPQRYVLVNIPSQTLWAVDDGKIAVKMAVVVGKPERPTKAFKAEITGIRFNPTWTVPPSIKVKDMLPQLQENPEALSDKGIEMVQNGESIDPASIDWQNISPGELNRIRMVQSAGKHNALGRIRVLMPNEFDIYLHDTNHPEFFNLVERTASSGCIRLSQPEQMARFVLAKNTGWSDKKMNGIIAKGRTVEVPVPAKFPVYVLYQTVWEDTDGNLIYGPDIYGEDKKLLKALSAINGYALPKSASGGIIVDKGGIPFGSNNVSESTALASAH